MNDGFSKATETFLGRYGVIHAAWCRFHDELGRVFEDLRKRVEPWGFGSQTYRFSSTGRHLVQFYRPNWHNEKGEGIHFEFFVDLDEMAKGHLAVGLDFGDETPEREATQTALQRLLEPYQHLLIEKHGYNLRPSFYWKFLRSSVSLPQVTANTLEEKCSVLPDLAPFVDEALAVAGKSQVWRTDFSRKDKGVSLEWHQDLGTGPQGGWELATSGGRFGIPCLKCYGERSNYCDGKNIVSIQPGQLFHDFKNGQRVYAAAIVHAADGGEVEFCAEAPKEGRWSAAFSGPCLLTGLNRWQVVVWEGTVSRSDDWDFAEQGLYAYVIVKAPTSGLRIDSIEFGTSN